MPVSQRWRFNKHSTILVALILPLNPRVCVSDLPMKSPPLFMFSQRAWDSPQISVFCLDTPTKVQSHTRISVRRIHGPNCSFLMKWPPSYVWEVITGVGGFPFKLTPALRLPSTRPENGLGRFGRIHLAGIGGCSLRQVWGVVYNALPHTTPT